VEAKSFFCRPAQATHGLSQRKADMNIIGHSNVKADVIVAHAWAKPTQNFKKKEKKKLTQAWTMHK